MNTMYISLLYPKDLVVGGTMYMLNIVDPSVSQSCFFVNLKINDGLLVQLLIKRSKEFPKKLYGNKTDVLITRTFIIFARTLALLNLECCNSFC